MTRAQARLRSALFPGQKEVTRDNFFKHCSLGFNPHYLRGLCNETISAPFLHHFRPLFLEEHCSSRTCNKHHRFWCNSCRSATASTKTMALTRPRAASAPCQMAVGAELDLRRKEGSGLAVVDGRLTVTCGRLSKPLEGSSSLLALLNTKGNAEAIPAAMDFASFRCCRLLPGKGLYSGGALVTYFQ